MPAQLQVMRWGHATSSGGTGRDQSPPAPSREGREAQDKGGKEPKIKEEKLLSGEKPQPAGGKSWVEGGSGNELGNNDPAAGLGIHHMRFIARSFVCKRCPFWDKTKTASSANKSCFRKL